MAWTSKELFDRVLREQEVARADIELMVKARVAEDLHLDWKGGKVVNAKTGGATIRKAVAGFANAEGGVLVLGVNGGDVGTGEKKWTMTPCFKTKGKQSTKEWVEQVLVPLRASLRPQPTVVAIDDGELVLIGVQRSDLLVQVVEKGQEVVHYLRFYGTTQKVPGYLLADLLLGRRQRPRMELAILDVDVGPKPLGSGASHRQHVRFQETQRSPWPYSITVETRNASLVWADEVAYGAVLMSEAAQGRRDGQGRKVAARLDVPHSVLANVSGRGRDGHDVVHAFHRGGNMAPFEKTELVRLTGFVPSMIYLINARREAATMWQREHGLLLSTVVDLDGLGDFRITYWAPVYVVARNSTPQWFQLRIVYDEQARVIENLCSCEPADGRPRIDITVEHKAFDAHDKWEKVEGFGVAPLTPAGPRD